MRAPLIITALLLGAPAHASAPDLFGYGARAQGLAGAVVSDARGHGAVHANPAGLAFETTPSVAIGYQFATFDLTLDGADHSTRHATATLIGFDLPLPLGGALAERITLGGGFVIPTNSVLIADIPRPGDPHFALVENRAQTVSLQAAVGVRVIDGWAIGAGFIALSALDGAIDVAPNAEGRIGSQARDQLVADYAPIFGLQGRLPAPLDDLRLGLTWRGASAARFYLPITANLGDRFPLPVPTLQIEGVAQYDPAALGYEISWAPADWRFALGGSHSRWSDYPIPIEYTAVNDDFPAQPSPGFDDILEWRLGVEWTPALTDAIDVAARMGYHFTPSPAPEQTGLHSLLDSDRHAITLGGGIRWDRLRLDLALQWHQMASRTHRKDPDAISAAGYDPEGRPLTHEHDGHILGGVIELGVDL